MRSSRYARLAQRERSVLSEREKTKRDVTKRRKFLDELGISY